MLLIQIESSQCENWNHLCCLKISLLAYPRQPIMTNILCVNKKIEQLTILMILCIKKILLIYFSLCFVLHYMHYAYIKLYISFQLIIPLHSANVRIHLLIIIVMNLFIIKVCSSHFFEIWIYMLTLHLMLNTLINQFLRFTPTESGSWSCLG